MAHRTFSDDFRRKVVAEHLHGGRRAVDIIRQYQLTRSVFYRWLQEYQGVSQAKPPPQDDPARQLAAAEQRIADLEAALGRKTMEVDFLQRSFKRAGLPFPQGPTAS